MLFLLLLSHLSSTGSASIDKTRIGTLKNQNKMPAFYKRYVDDTVSKMPDVSSASEFLLTLNEIHPSLSFTMELEDNGKLPFLGMVIIRNGPRLDTEVYVKTNRYWAFIALPKSC